MKSGDVIQKYIKEYIEKHAWTPWGNVELKIAALSNDAALWGMKYLLDTTEVSHLESDRVDTAINPNN
jgi:glucokinase